MNCKTARSLFFIPLNCISTVTPEPFTESLRPCLCVCVCVCICVLSRVWGFENHSCCRYFSPTVPFLFNLDWLKHDKEKETERENQVASKWPLHWFWMQVSVCVCVCEGDKEKELSVCVHDSRQTVVAWKGLGLTLWGLCVPWHPHNVNYYPWSGWAAVNAQEKIIPIHVLIHARSLDQM